MKKIVFLLFASAVLSCLIFGGLSAAERSEADTGLSYDGRIYDAQELSQATIDWLNWYNSLPAETQEMVNYIPAELWD